jgi:hypothetical protein
VEATQALPQVPAEVATQEGAEDSPYHSSAIEPKVIAPHDPKHGQAPRRIEVERKKRLFAAQDIEELLKEGGIDYNPPCEHPEVSPTELPLFAFDDHEFEVHGPEEWMALGFDGGTFKGLPAKALDPSDKKWKNCKVVAHVKVPYTEYKNLTNTGSNMVSSTPVACADGFSCFPSSVLSTLPVICPPETLLLPFRI